MRYFVTGATGWIGSAVVPELVRAGHEVVALVRSDQSAAAARAMGADPRPGDLGDLDGLAAAAAGADGVVHLAYDHDFSRMEAAAGGDLAAITAMGAALEGSGRPLLIAAGVLGLAVGRTATEEDQPDLSAHPRSASAHAARALADRGVRSMAVRFAPTVHGPHDPGFVATLVGIARRHSVSGYIGDGQNRWPAVHRQDAADLVRRAVEGAPAGAALHAVAEDGIPTRLIAEAIGADLDLPVASVPAGEADDHFGWLGRFFGADVPASSTRTRQLLDWHPTGPGLLAEIEAGHYH